MYPDLSYLLHDIFGTDVDNWTSIFKTFGLMLALTFVVSYWYVRAELKRKEEEGLILPVTKTIVTKGGFDFKEIIYNSIVFGILGLKIPYMMSHFPEFQQDPASVLLSSKGNWLIGILTLLAVGGFSYYTQKKEDRKAGTSKVVVHAYERTGDIIITSAISGVLGAKVFSILENLDSFFADPLGQLFSGSGLTIYGGLIFGAIAVYTLVKKIGINPIHMLDIGGPTILLGYAVGRMGCQLSGDGDWGITAKAQPDWWFLPDWMWSYTFPSNVNNAGQLIEGCSQAMYNSVYQAGMAVEVQCKLACGVRYCHELPAGVYPTSIFEIIISLIGVGILWMFRKRIKIAGMMFAFYLIYNGIERFFIETIRVNERYDYFGLNWSQAQFISVGLIISGIIGALWLWKYGTRYEPKTA